MTEQLVREVDALRTRIDVLKAEREQLKNAPADKATALARIDGFVSYLSGEARVNVGPFVSREASQPRDLIAPAQVRTDGGLGSVGFAPVLAFLAWHNADAIRAALVRDVEAYYATRGEGVEDSTLAKRFAAIDAELLVLETDEERAIMALEAAGVRSVMRRRDADPRALVAACS